MDQNTKNLEEFIEKNQDEIKGLGMKKFSGPENDANEIKMLKEDLLELIRQISVDGKIDNYDWNLLRKYIAVAIKDALFYINTKYPDCGEKTGDTFEDILGDLIDLFMLFEKEPPFTMQRICEIILEPEKYYKSSKKYCYAMERVISTPVTP